MNSLRAAAFAALCMLVAGCWSTEQVKGSGNVISENRTVGEFDWVTLSGNGKLEVEQNGSESLSISADDNLLPLITSEIDGKLLMLKVKSGYNLNPSKPIVFRVSAKTLRGIACSGDTIADLKGLHADVLKLQIAGSGDMSAEGTVDRQELMIGGSGKFLGGGLKSKEAKISIIGSGDAVVAASDSLEVSISGSGSVKYFGDPRIKQNVVGSGSITKQ